MKPRTILLVATLSTLIFTGCQNNDLSAENTSLKQQITEMEQQITGLEQQVTELAQTKVRDQTLAHENKQLKQQTRCVGKVCR